ncbi:PREDICTED: transcription factor HES-1-B-like [Cyprinodon variegatus]|uniref:transcription factor HES-1-B-like n=1 Tax=Cyprinodon variegatus TaxID=28743 RepID=UPI0007429B8F|nr:PREDICTED: transcription factor HES-1-B-like [Cyprinodon variegatus]
MSHEPLACASCCAIKAEAGSLRQSGLRAAGGGRTLFILYLSLFGFGCSADLTMPAGTLERSSPAAVAAIPARGDATPGKPRIPSESRKSSKPIMEKRRRARINESLGQLKTLILEALRKDVRSYAAIGLDCVCPALNTDPSNLGKYRAGFSECIGEVTRFLSTCEGVTAEVRTRLLSHLAACVAQIHSLNLSSPGFGELGQTGGVPVAAHPGLQLPLKGVSVCPEAPKLYGGFQVVASPDGQFAFLIPNAALTPLSVQNSHPLSPAAPAVTSDSVWRPW